MSAAFLLMLITAISKVTGFLRELVFGYFMGTEAIKDIYVIATSIPSVLFGFVFQAVLSSFIPIYNKVKNQEGKKAADKFTSNLVNSLIIVATIAVILGIIFARPLVKLLASGWEGKQLDYAVTFTRVVIFAIYSLAISSPFSGYLNIHNDFLNPSINGIIMNAVIIISCFLAFYNNNWIILAVGYVVGHTVQYLNFIPAVKKHGYKHSKYLNFNSQYLKELAKISVPIIISVAASKISSIVDKTIATNLFESGAVSALDYASRLTDLVNGIVIVSFTTAAYPQFTRFAQEGKLKNLKKSVNKTLISGFLLVFPATVGLFVLAEPITSFVYERGAFNELSTMITGGALRWYSISLLGLLVYSIMTRAFYSLGDTISPVRMMFVQVIVDIPLNFLLSYVMGLNGLALSSSLGIIAAGIYSVRLFRKKVGKIAFKKSIVSFIKIGSISILMGIIVSRVYEFFLYRNMRLALILSILIGALVYLILILFANIDEVKLIVNKVYWKIKGKKNKNK